MTLAWRVCVRWLDGGHRTLACALRESSCVARIRGIVRCDAGKKLTRAPRNVLEARDTQKHSALLLQASAATWSASHIHAAARGLQMRLRICGFHSSSQIPSPSNHAHRHHVSGDTARSAGAVDTADVPAQAAVSQSSVPPMVQTDGVEAPYCEQLAMAGNWQTEQVKMEASYEGITGLNPDVSPRELEDRLPRWPDFTTGGLVRSGDYLGTAVFSMTGTLTAAGAGMDMLGGCVVGTITAVGGGTIRDVLIARDENGRPKRAFWMDEPEYLYIALVASFATFVLWNTLAPQYGLDESDSWIFWLDSAGIGCFCIIGAMHGIRAGLPSLVCAICGLLTSTFGGVTRDVLSHRPVRILHSHSEVYASTAFSGALAYVFVRRMGASYTARVLAGFSTAVALRYIAWTSDVKLPIMESVYSTRSVEQAAGSSKERRPAHSSGVDALHKREMQRLEVKSLASDTSPLSSILHYGVVSDPSKTPKTAQTGSSPASAAEVTSGYLTFRAPRDAAVPDKDV